MGVRKLDLLFLISKLGEFALFDDFFPDLADFQDLDNFWSFDIFPVFNNFPYFYINSSPLSITPTSLAASTSLAKSTYDDILIFRIDVSDVAILLKP